MKAQPIVGPCFFALLGENLFVSRSFIFVLCWMPLFFTTKAEQYEEMILQDKPSLYFRFNDVEGTRIPSKVGNLFADIVGKVDLVSPGPLAKYYPYFNSDNKAIRLSGGQQYLRLKDPGSKSVLDFNNGDSITLEAWVNPTSVSTYSYIIGKGRTQNSGMPTNNQNYSLRLTSVKAGRVGISFLFRNKANKEDADWHRWTSSSGFTLGAWHHVAISYTYGDSKSIRGYIDGLPVKGVWDMGGETADEPWTGNDEVWIGSSMGGKQAVTLQGGIDEVAIYRHVVSASRMKMRYKFDAPRFIDNPSKAPAGYVKIDIHEGVSENWNLIASDPVESFREPAFAIPYLPNKYNSKGIIIDRPDVFLLRAQTRVVLPKGQIKLLLRSRTSSRLKINGEKIVSLKKASTSTSAHGKVSKNPENLGPVTRLLRPGMQEVVVEYQSDGKEVHLLLEAFVGGAGKRRPETGELCLAFSAKGKPFEIISPKSPIILTDSSWNEYLYASRERIRLFNSKRRASVGLEEVEKWQRKHEGLNHWAKNNIHVAVPKSVPGYSASNEIDHFINAKLNKVGRSVLPLVNDDLFLKRVSLDVIGVVPSVGSFSAFKADKSPNKRAKAIERYLDDELGWADHWTSYWQDVLAENPNIVKPKLNNTGPFRFWIHESLQDNKPMDRFVSELVMMEGSRYYGGTSGFGVATQNDVPMAAKAQIISQAFLGMQMKCARCHDAPFHSFNQEDLFSIAAMLQRGALKVPPTSSVPLIPGHKSKVEVTLKPGVSVSPKWPFIDKPLGQLKVSDSRARLASMITEKNAKRFSEVMVNRIWKRYLGWGLVDSVDDWEEAEPSHPELLKWLSREFVFSGYDFKHIARLILNSHVYQRQIDPVDLQARNSDGHFNSGPVRRRMSAEQILDSLFAVAGKEMSVEPLTLDINGRGTVSTFLNLGIPRKSWEFTSLSNERDRPSLAIPRAQTIVDALQVFGWRDTRQDALSKRDEAPNILQPSIVANGVVGRRITQLSDDSAFTKMALQKQNPGALIENLYVRVLSRNPTNHELGTMKNHIAPGYMDRIIRNAKPFVIQERVLDVSWNNHLSEEANRIKIEIERLVLEGDQPTSRLNSDWRRRFEDVVYALINSPEFIFVP